MVRALDVNGGVDLILNWFNCVMQNGTLEEVKKIVAMLNEGAVPSSDVVGKFYRVLYILYKDFFF